MRPDQAVGAPALPAVKYQPERNDQCEHGGEAEDDTDARDHGKEHSARQKRERQCNRTQYTE